jgi:diguanylate cyclase
MYFANQIRERIAASTYIADKQEINVTMSIGVCTVTPKETDELKDVISAADIALYEAKNTGRNRVRNAGQLTVHTGNVVS